MTEQRALPHHTSTRRSRPGNGFFLEVPSGLSGACRVVYPTGTPGGKLSRIQWLCQQAVVVSGCRVTRFLADACTRRPGGLRGPRSCPPPQAHNRARPINAAPGEPLMRRAVLVALASFVLLAAAFPGQAGKAPTRLAGAKKLRVAVVGAHPDDPESGCGGLIALLSREGLEVVAAYLTCYRGDRKIGNEPEATVRWREATAACQILGARPHFFDYAHEKLAADAATADAVGAWLKPGQPDVVVTHWPLDTHPNHHVTGSLVWPCYLGDAPWGLYFFEVMTDRQSLGFRPELYLDIEAVRDRKRQALDSHRSQNPDAILETHDAMHRRRGEEAGVRDAEAFLRADGTRERPKLPVTFLSPKR